MSVVALAMNGFLAVLLVAALIMGFRLERRLRGVRDSHAVFAKAVADLDAATMRAATGLAELRAATDEAIDLLGGRIARAKEAGDRLDRTLAEADKLGRRPLVSSEFRSSAQKPAESPAALKGLLELVESARAETGVGPMRRPAPELPAQPQPQPPPQLRRPRSIDDDLFEDAGAF